MKIEIWSDIVCPFCYIGKRKFEIALKEFSHQHVLEIEFKSFQLNPNTITDTEMTVHQYLAQHKGISVEEATGMGDHVTRIASEVGLKFDFDNAVVANTFLAHQMLHFAKASGMQQAAKERLLKAYFTEGKNMDDLPTLLELAKETGLNVEKLKDALTNQEYAEAVRYDIYEAQQLRIQGVPFFVFDRKYGVSGAQSPEVFLQTLDKSHSEWQAKQAIPALEVEKGESCDADGNCD